MHAVIVFIPLPLLKNHMATPKEVRLTSVPESVYMVLLEYKAKEEKRLKRVCTFTDAVRAIINDRTLVAISNNTGDLLNKS